MYERSQLLLYPALGAKIFGWHPGLSKSDLTRELADLLALPAYQLALPFSHQARRQLGYARTLAGTSA